MPKFERTNVPSPEPPSTAAAAAVVVVCGIVAIGIGRRRRKLGGMDRAREREYFMRPLFY